MWVVACFCQHDNSGDDSVRTITAQFVLGLGIVWLISVDVKVAVWIEQCGVAMEFI